MFTVRIYMEIVEHNQIYNKQKMINDNGICVTSTENLHNG